MKAVTLMLTGAVTVLLSASCSKTDHNTALNDTDKKFVLQASYSNKDEIGAGTLASSKGMRDSIKIFGSMMVMDHTAAEASLDSIASSLSLTTAHGPDSLHQVIVQKLMSMSGKQFDTAYIHGQVTDHQNTIMLFQDEITNGTNKKLQDFAGKTLPKIQMHYNMAVSISASE